jgi:Peptidase family M23
MAWWNNAISHGYIPNYQGAGTDTPHYAIDLATPFHTPFSFPTTGTITQADYAVWSGQPGGGEVFMKPDTGGETQYAYHLDEIDVHPGQHVNAGQQVGLTGGQNQGGSHPTSPMWSSGPHLHYGFFDKYVSTQAGGRPYGSDPTAYVQNLSKNNGAQSDILPGILGGAAAGATGSAAAGSNPITWQSFFGVPTQDQLIRGALIIGGAIAIIMGLHSLLQKSGIQMPQAPSSDSSDQASQASQASPEQKSQAASNKQYLRRSGRGIAPPPPGQAAGGSSEMAEAAEVAA